MHCDAVLRSDEQCAILGKPKIIVKLAIARFILEFGEHFVK